MEEKTRKEQIEARKVEIKSEVEAAEDKETIETLTEEVEALDEELKALNEHQENASLVEQLETKSVTVKEISKEEKKMEEKFTVKSAEYRTAWAKSMMGLTLDEVDKRAIGDAVGTTATTFVEADGSHNGINNLGLLIPESVRLDLLKMAEEASPIYRDITKLNIPGNVDFPYLFAADDAEWYAEANTTKNEGQEYRNIKLTGHELAKAIEITWKAEAMTVDGFIDFLLRELNIKMNKALITGVIYGTGSGEPTGITDSLSKETNANPIDLAKTLLGSLTGENRVGAKVYVASDVGDAILFYKDENGNYPYLVGGLNRVGAAQIEVDPFLADGDVVVGNAANYILNFNQPLRVDKEIKVQPRRVVYGGYLIADGNKKPGAFAYGSTTVISG